MFHFVNYSKVLLRIALLGVRINGRQTGKYRRDVLE